MGTMRLFKVWLLIALMVLSGGSLAFAQTNTFPDSGNVGIGTVSPASTKLHVAGAGNSVYMLRMQNTNGGGSEYGLGIGAQGIADLFTIDDITAGSLPRLAVTSSGNVGIGTVSPASTKLHVAGAGNSVYMLRMQNTNGGGSEYGLGIGAQGIADLFTIDDITAGWLPRLAVTSSGNVGIGTTSPSSKLHVDGNARITGDLTTDGNIAAKYQDVAEWVRTPTRLAPGTVVVIDPQENNQVLPASQAYDTRVAGVVSAQPGIILGEAAEDKAKVAHSGRVKVKADARFGSIETGDLLVSSSTPGHAMASKPVEVNGISIHRPGTIVGKALEPLKEGQGEILVFLTLQ